MLPPLLLLALLAALHSPSSPVALSQPGKARCGVAPRCPATSVPPKPCPFPRIRPRPPLYPPTLKLMPDRPANNPGPLANRARILFITQELKRNITYDPFKYTATWTGNNYCLFKGFFCATVPDRNITGLASVDFSGARFGGKFLNFYRFIRNLPDIALFFANSNNFSGPIYPSISKLRYLYQLDLSNNKFQGSFPYSLLGATNLTFVDFRFNTYAGTIPRQLFSAVDTDVLFANNNGFNGTIPANFGDTPAKYLTFANNKFTGSIPSSIGRAWETLTEALFIKNSLSGCLPYEIGFLGLATVFDASLNLLTGPIPQSFGCLKSLQILNLANNQLYGEIPESLCRLPGVYNITLSFNYFTQVGLECRRLIKARRLHVGQNCILGLAGQKSAVECARFFAKPRTCPRPDTYSILTCVLPPRNGRRLRELEEMPAQPMPRTYAMLEEANR